MPARWSTPRVIAVTAAALLLSLVPLVLLTRCNVDDASSRSAARLASGGPGHGGAERGGSEGARPHPLTGETGDQTLERMRQNLASGSDADSRTGGGAATGGGGAASTSRVDGSAGGSAIDGAVGAGAGSGSGGSDASSLADRIRAGTQRREVERQRQAAIAAAAANARHSTMVATAGTRVFEFDVERLNNAGAAAAVRGVLAALPGYREADVQAAQGRVSVRLDQTSAMTPTQIAQRLTAAGYPATSVTP